MSYVYVLNIEHGSTEPDCLLFLACCVFSYHKGSKICNYNKEYFTSELCIYCKIHIIFFIHILFCSLGYLSSFLLRFFFHILYIRSTNFYCTL